MEHLVVCQSVLVMCSITMVSPWFWIHSYRTPKIPMEDPVYGASCGMPKCSCDVKYPMVSPWYGSSYRTPKGFLWRNLWCPYAM
ncbi:hypothetical protein CEXT_19761 [Caerostris extrusa]|uniref:Uncharacterized protein n=1 Tax=Caerostris extrusa TaxID=172846 RepID=A0AAV4TN37_CAEEX|nr:hypothetical protein CEXT_19761 [Caerostris extrusa]